MRDKLLDELGSIRKIDGPLDMILNHFGPDAVAEITGRTTRVVWREVDGTTKRVKENRSKRHSEAEENDFMSGKKRILVFSEAGGTGRSFHADMSKKNQQHRIHYLVQAGWRADAAIQGLGRSHRTNEASQPHYVLCSTDVPAQVRFTSTIARRLDQLGALTRGQRQTGGQGIFQARDNLENEYAEQAVHGFIRDLARQGSIGGLTFSEFELQSGLKLRNQFGSVDATAVEEIQVRQFLNRTLSFDLPTQELVYSEVFTRLDELVQIAESNGTLDIGMETIRAKSIVEKRGEVVRVDEESGAKTEYHLLETEHDAQYNKFPGSDGKFVKGYYHNEKTGRLIAIVSDIRSKYADGDVNKNYFAALAPASYGDVTESNLAKNYKKITVAEASKLWQEQLNSLPKTIKKPLHLITGTLLPIWDRLPNSHVKIMRAKTDSGKVLLGRTIHPKAIDKVLKSLGVGGNTYSSAEAVAAILENGDEAELANGWKLKRKTVSGEKRIEIVGPDIGNREELDIAGVFSERIQYQTRFFIPKDKAVEVIEKLTKNRPITGLGAPTQASDPLYSAEYLVARYAKKGLNNAATIVKKGFEYIRSGLTQFAKWARQMVNEFGQAVKKHLRSLFKDLSDFNKRLGRTGAISGRPASTVTGKTTGQVLARPAKMKDFQWKKENYRTVNLEYTSPDTGKVAKVAKLLKVNNKWFWADTNREFLTLATAAKTVKSEIFEKVRNTEREQVKLIEEARARRTARQAKATKKVEAYLSQPTAAEEVTKKELPVTVADKISTFADRVTRALFDRRLMLKKVQKLIELVSGKPLPDWANPYERFDVIDGRIETNKNEFKDKYWKPMMDLLDKAKISYEDFNNFVYAMHAPERNKYINEINPGF
ncbi:MAG TPA: strawberry notch C-terminal domain-containing protein, partial [Candidatus Rifleibacterium sp.]|nr:strawberry notch C-terminal domain-containing protein [Candidatus Rifleibacterium sp.]